MILRFLAVPKTGDRDSAEVIEEPETAEGMHAAALRELASCFPGMEYEDAQRGAFSPRQTTTCPAAPGTNCG